MLVDNCTAHEELKTDDGNIVIVPLPPNVTSVLQPMDQSPIRVTKMKYRKLLLASVVAKENKPIDESLKEHTIRDAIVMLKDAWADIPNSLLHRAFSKIRDWDKDEYSEEDLVPLSALRASPEYYTQLLNEVQTLLNEIAPGDEIASSEIEEWNIDTTDNVELEDAECSDSDGEAATDVIKVTHTEAIENVNKLIEWCAQNEAIGLKHTFNLMNLRSDIVTTHTTKHTKQKAVTDYFK